MTAIATPRRSATAVDVPRRWPRPLGGDNGTVATPSRQAAIEGTGVPERPGQTPPVDGARGGIGSLLHFLGVPWWNVASPAARRQPSPHAYDKTLYVRQAVPNVVPISRFAAMQDADTSGTLNTSAAATTATAPIPYSRRQVVQTFYEAFDTRVQTVYYPREQIQQPQMPRRVLAGPAATPRMARPYQPRLTHLDPTVTYGQQTTVLGRAVAKGGRRGG